jgi:transposase
MNLHLAEIAKAVAPGAHGVLLLDQAGWHTTKKLIVPANITLLPLPARSPELNPVENL